jgi:DNA primase
LKQSQPYLDYLLDRAAGGHNLNSDEGRVKFLAEMLPIAARIPDEAMRDRFGDRLAFKARVTDEIVRSQIRKAAVQRQTTFGREGIATRLTSFGNVTKAEKGLIWWLVHEPGPALAALESLQPADLEGLTSRSVLDLALELNENRGFSPSVLLERLTTVEAQLVTGIASEREPHVNDAESCAQIIRRMRCEREHAAIQREIDHLQELGASEHSSRIDALWAQKHELLRRLEGLI